MLTTRTAISVHAAHTDSLGHLNHVRAVEYLERARDDWYQASGLWGGRAWSGNETLATVVVNIDVSYRAECFRDDELSVATFALRRGNRSFTLGQEIIRAGEILAVEARVVSVIMDLDSRQVVPVPATMAAHLPRD